MEIILIIILMLVLLSAISILINVAIQGWCEIFDTIRDFFKNK